MEPRPRRFRNVGWTAGTFCNASCGHCYSARPRAGGGSRLTSADVARVVEQLRRLGVRSVNIGGNEPIFTHGPNPRESILPLILESLLEAGIPVGFTTNGITFRHLYEHHRDLLRRVNDIDFSLDWPSAGRHDAARGLPLFATVVHGIEAARSLSVPCSVVVCAMKENFNRPTLSAFLQLTRLLGVELRFNLLKPVQPELLDRMPTPEQLLSGFLYLSENASCSVMGESCLAPVLGDGMSGCPCGTSSFRIGLKTPEGRIPITPCVYLSELLVGDLLTEDIFDILESAPFRQFARRAELAPAECREAECEFLESCRGGCAARTFYVRGTLEAKDPSCLLPLLSPADGSRRVKTNGRPRDDERLRVHEDYLCTWIGATDPSFEDPRFPDVGRFLEG